MSKSIEQIGLARRGTGEVRPEGYAEVAAASNAHHFRSAVSVEVEA